MMKQQRTNKLLFLQFNRCHVFQQDSVMWQYHMGDYPNILRSATLTIYFSVNTRHGISPSYPHEEPDFILSQFFTKVSFFDLKMLSERDSSVLLEPCSTGKSTWTRHTSLPMPISHLETNVRRIVDTVVKGTNKPFIFVTFSHWRYICSVMKTTYA